MAPDLQEDPDGDVVAAVVLPVYGPDGTCLTDLGPDPVAAAGGAPRTGEQRQVEAIRSCPPGPELDAWLRDLDLPVLSSMVLVEVVAAQARIESYQHARTLGMIAELASREEMSPEWSPLAGAPPTQACVAGDELAMRLGWPRVTATKTVHRALVLDGMLGATREALEAGHLDPAKAQVLTAGLADLSFQAAHAVEDAVLPDADQCSVAELRQRVQREIRLVDPDGAAGRHDRARRTRKVSHPRPQPDGMASMWLVLDAADAIRVDGVLTHAAKTAKALGDGRTLDQLRADGLRDLVVGDVPASDGPAFEVQLTPGPPQPPQPRRSWNGATFTDRDGLVLTRPVEPIPIATLIPAGEAVTVPASGERDLAPPDSVPALAPAESRAARRGCTRCSGRPGAEVRVTIPASTLLGLDDQPAHLDGHGPIDAVAARALAAGGVWQRVVTDPLTDRVLDVGRERYRPPAALDELVRTRDGTCAAPGAPSPPAAATSTTPRSSTPSPAPTPTHPSGAPTPTISDPCATGTTASRPTAGSGCARSAPGCSSGSPPPGTATSPAPAPGSATTPRWTRTTKRPRSEARGRLGVRGHPVRTSSGTRASPSEAGGPSVADAPSAADTP